MKLLSLCTLMLFGLIVGLMAGCSGNSAVFGRSIAGSNADTGEVQLNWAASTGSPYGYYVEQSSDGVNFTQVATVIQATSVTIKGLAHGKTYFFRIRAYNQGGDSSYTSTTTILVPSPSPSPS